MYGIPVHKRILHNDSQSADYNMLVVTVSLEPSLPPPFALLTLADTLYRNRREENDF